MWLALLAALAPFQMGEEEAPALLERAEEAARAGRYREARRAYERLAARHPATAAGRIAERRSRPSAFLGWDRLVDHGPSSNRVDIVLMGDGYELEQLEAFDELAADIPPLFERQEPFREYWSYFNVLRASLVSAQNGVDGFGREYDTALGAYTLGTDAGHVGIDGERVAAMLAELSEHDGLTICFVKNGVAGTGGGGYAAIGGRDPRTTMHEWGHAFGGLGDEYDTPIARHQSPVGESPNVSASEDERHVPWAHWIAARHPSVGVYEGAAARVKGAFKPTSAGCLMGSASTHFCPVCTEALVLRIYSIVDPIERTSPEPQPLGIEEPFRVGEQGLSLRLVTMQPASHDLEVRWWILPAPRQPISGPPPAPGRTRAAPAIPPTRPPRTERGPLVPLDEPPARVTRLDSDGEHELRIQAADLAPGRYRVVCRVRDTTELRGERWPLVLKDELGLLESERIWWIEVPSH
jgi:hypothetical protein